MQSLLVARELHHGMDVVAKVDEKSVRGPLGVRIYHFGPARSALHERGDLLDGIGGHRLLVELLELADARNLDVQASHGVGLMARCHGGNVASDRRPSLESCDCLRLSSDYGRLEPAGCDQRADRAQRRGCARVDALLDRVRDRGGALVIRGEPGIGKSALLDRARGRASSLGCSHARDRGRRV